jgi:hypothetical protein
LALILRAADQSRLILAKSMNAVFKTVVPYIRTEHKESLSPSSVRASSYSPEQIDKDKAINALQKMIDLIKDY